MFKAKKYLKHKNTKYFFLVLGGLFSIVIVFHFVFWNRIYPGVQVVGVNVSGKNLEEAEEAISKIPKPEKITLVHEGNKYEITADSIGVEYRNTKTALRAFDFGRRDGMLQAAKEKWRALIKRVNLPLSISVDSEKIDEEINRIASDLAIPSVEPSVNIQSKKVSIHLGRAGQEVDRESLREKIFHSLAFAKQNNLEIPVNKLNSELTKEQSQILEKRATKIIGKQLHIGFERETFPYSDQNLATILGHEESFLNKEKAGTFVADLAEGVNRAPQDAKFEFADGKVKEFTPAKDGIRVNNQEAVKKLSEALKRMIETEEKIVTLELPVLATKPETQNQDVNNLGINELIGKGESIYKGSIPSRVHNLSLAASRLNGVLIKPGEEFSFNKALGDISLATGYQQAYVIKEGKTILDDGGGVCQTSTTFFRAALNTGLPILERNQHSYRVSYYEQGSKPGYDAAIYLPNVDLRIKNDTPGHILIQTKNDTKNAKLVFEFYGTTDGRKSEILNYRQWDARPAPPDLYQDDPTLPVGTTKQTEKSVPGLKTAFDYKVTRNGDTIFEKTFTSNFRPWQAVYLRGTAGQ